VADDVDECGIELRTAALARDGDGRFDAAGPVVHTEDVRQRHQARRDEDGVACELLGLALAVPTLEGLVDAGAHILVEPEARGEVVGGVPVVLQHDRGVAMAFDDEAEPDAGPLQERPAGAQMRHDEAGRRETDGVDQSHVPLQCLIVAEPLRLLVGVDVAAQPRHERGVIQRPPLRLVESDTLAEAERDEALAHDVFHRLSHAEVGAERESGKQFGEADPAWCR
jgi:hypothetical protein